MAPYCQQLWCRHVNEEISGEKNTKESNVFYGKSEGKLAKCFFFNFMKR